MEDKFTKLEKMQQKAFNFLILDIVDCDFCGQDIECYEGNCFTNGKAFADEFGYVACASCLNSVSLEGDTKLRFVAKGGI